MKGDSKIVVQQLLQGYIVGETTAGIKGCGSDSARKLMSVRDA